MTSEQKSKRLREIADRNICQCAKCQQSNAKDDLRAIADELERQPIILSRIAAFLGDLCNCCQLLDGWHCDTAWTDWDTEVRQQMGKLCRLLYEANGMDPDASGIAARGLGSDKTAGTADATSEVAAYAGEKAEAPAREPKCMTCGKPATCYGKYEGIEGYSCDDCCGHGNEDGFCEHIATQDDGWIQTVTVEADGTRTVRLPEEDVEWKGAMHACTLNGWHLCVRAFWRRLHAMPPEPKEVSRDELLRLLTNLVRQLDLVHQSPEYKSVWTMYSIHGGRYAGPTYTKELDEARTAIAKEQP